MLYHVLSKPCLCSVFHKSIILNLPLISSSNNSSVIKLKYIPLVSNSNSPTPISFLKDKKKMPFGCNAVWTFVKTLGSNCFLI